MSILPEHQRLKLAEKRFLRFFPSLLFGLAQSLLISGCKLTTIKHDFQMCYKTNAAVATPCETAMLNISKRTKQEAVCLIVREDKGGPEGERLNVIAVLRGAPSMESQEVESIVAKEAKSLLEADVDRVLVYELKGQGPVSANECAMILSNLN